MEQLENRIIVNAKKENLLVERQENSGLIKQLIPFMEKYGYKDGNGWWVKMEAEAKSRANSLIVNLKNKGKK